MYPGAILAILGNLYESLMHASTILLPFYGFQSWGHPRPSYANLGPSWVHPGAVLGTSLCMLGNPRAVLCKPEQSWRHAGCILGNPSDILGASRAAHSGPFCVHPWAIPGSSWAILRAFYATLVQSWAILSNPGAIMVQALG